MMGCSVKLCTYIPAVKSLCIDLLLAVYVYTHHLAIVLFMLLNNFGDGSYLLYIQQEVVCLNEAKHQLLYVYCHSRFPYKA